MKRKRSVEYDELSSEEVSRLELANAVKGLRAHFGESQQVFATKLGLSIRGIANYEGALRIPEPKILALLAKTAADAGRDDLAFEFLYEIGAALQLDEILDGAIMSWNRLKKRGYLLLQLDDKEASNHALAYYRASRAVLSATTETKTKAKTLLDQFATDISKQIPSQKPKDFVTGSLPPARKGKKRGKS